MFYAIFTEYKDYFPLHPGSIAAIRVGKVQKPAGALVGAISNGLDLLSPVQKSTGPDDMIDCFVFLDKMNALTSLKCFPIARMEVFDNLEEARQFALRPDYMQTDDDQPLKLMSDFVEPPLRHHFILRKHVIAGDYEMVKSMIRDNPKTLVTSSGQPTNLSMSFDYNLIHICAQYNWPKIAELILNTICCPYFVNLFLEDGVEPLEYQELSKDLLNVFLNMTEKIWGETPLHIAAKYGNVEVVKVLISLSLCKSQTNKNGHLPVDIICKCATDSTDDIFRNIRQLLLERYVETEDLPSSSNNDYRKQLSGLSFESPLSPVDYCLQRKKKISPNARRCLFNSTSDKENCIELSNQVSTEPNAEVKPHDSSSFDTMPLISNHEISSASTLDPSPGIILNETFDVTGKSLAGNISHYFNPWQSIERSLLKNIQLIAELLIRKLQNMSSSNGILIFQIQRLQALIWNLQKNEQFNEVAFEKIHAHVASLLITSIATSQNIVDIMANIEIIISELLTECPLRIESFFKCISAYFLKKLKESASIHPNSIKNDKLCAIVLWMEEESCNCQWQDNNIRMELSPTSFPELKTARKRLNEDFKGDFKKLIILDNEPTKNDVQVDGKMKSLYNDNQQEGLREIRNIFIPVNDKGKIHSDEKSFNCQQQKIMDDPRSVAECSIDVSKCIGEKAINSDQSFCMSSLILSLSNISNDKSNKSDLDVDKKEKKAILPISIEVSKTNESIAQKISKCDKLLVFKTPEKKSNGIFSLYREKHDSDVEDDLLTETQNVYPVSTKPVDITNKRKYFIPKTTLIKKSVISTTTTKSKQTELFTKYRQKAESDDEQTLMGTNEPSLSD